MKPKNVFPSRAALCILTALCVLLAALPLSLAQTAESETPPFTRTLSEGDEGDDVRAAQERLRALLYYHQNASGVFDAETTASVRLFQRANDLLESGMLDEITWNMLFAPETLSYEHWQLSHLITPTADAASASASSAVWSGAAGETAGRPARAFGGEPAWNTNEYSVFAENRFLSVQTAPLSTFAADVDTASYAKLRAAILAGQAVPPDSVRIEEMLNYFQYDYPEPKSGEPFGVAMELADCPWNAETKLLLIGLQAKKIPAQQRPPQNLVFLLDVSGSMNSPGKLPLVKRAFALLLEALAPTDVISLVTYASRDEIVLDGVPAADKTRILEAIDSLEAGGMTAGAAGIQTAYELAEKHLLAHGNNRVLLATDGDLNLGVSDEGSLARLTRAKRESGVFLSVLGFGDGNYKDNKLEALADHGNGNYSYIDTVYEARRALVTEIGATFLTVAKDVKLQLDFNPAKVRGYRLIGYENRVMAAEDFADDTKDGGELGSGHRVTALYELVPVDSAFRFGEAESRYQEARAGTGDEWLTLNLRAKEPDGDESALYEYPLTDAALTDAPSDNLRFAAAVAQVGMLLRNSEWKGDATYQKALSLLRGCASVSGDALKEEFLYLTTLLDRASPPAEEPAARER